MNKYTKPSVRATVVLLIDEEGRIALARKKQAIHHEGGQIEYSLGLYNGYGGKMEEEDGNIEATALRELYDESGVRGETSQLEHSVRVYFYLEKSGEVTPFMDVQFYLLREWEGAPSEGKEMGPPIFFAQSDIPYNEMMPADKVIFSKVLQGEKGEYNVFLKGKGVEPVIEKEG